MPCDLPCDLLLSSGTFNIWPDVGDFSQMDGRMLRERDRERSRFISDSKSNETGLMNKSSEHKLTSEREEEV